MAEQTIIRAVSPQDFQEQSYKTQDKELLGSAELDTVFSSSTDYIEYNIYDLNQNLIYPQTLSVASTNYSVVEGDVNLNPERDLNSNGFDEGSYYISYDFYRYRCGSRIQKRYYISEISNDRTELRLLTTAIGAPTVIPETNDFIQYRETQDYFVDFYLNFGQNQTIIANNIAIQGDPELNEDVSLLIKLYEPLPSEFDIKSECWIVERISLPQAYQVTMPIEEFVPDDFQYIAGPNYSLQVKGQTGQNTQDFSYTNLINSDQTGSVQQIKNLLEKKEIDINVDYTDFNNFIHFSSAQTRLENFYYKVGLIQSASNQITNQAITGANTGSVAYSASNAIIEKTIDDIIEKFDGFEYFMYFNSGSSKSYPKDPTILTPPFALLATGSTQVLEWLGSADPTSSYYGGQALSASDYDINNKDYLYNTIPEYLTSDSDNKNYELFVDMVGQHYDNVWLYTKKITTRFNTDNRLEFGISQDLVADAIRDFGIKLYSNNFNTDDLYLAFLGLTPSGSTFPVTDITGSIDATSGVPLGLEYVDTEISASSDIVPLDKVNKSLYKRIYHNIPYLLKSKGTIQGLRALISSYGIPDTILRINEFGGQDRIQSQDWDYAQEKFSYALKTNTAIFTSSFALNDNFVNSFGTRPSTVQYRFKTNGIPTQSAAYSQSIFVTDGGFSSPQYAVGMTLEYNQDFITSGSYSGSITSPSSSYGTLSFFPNGVTNAANKASLEMPFFDGNWWSVMVTHDDGEFSLFSANEMYGQIGFSGSSTISADKTAYEDAENAFWALDKNIFLANKTVNPFSGSLQEIRYYNQPISESVFHDFVVNPNSYEGNNFTTTYDNLAFRLPLGNLLRTASGENVTSVHPKVSGSTPFITASFKNNGSTGSFGTVVPQWNTNYQKVYMDQIPAGIKNRSTEKIKLSQNIIPSGDTLSSIESIAQTSFISQSYTANPDYLEVAFSPQDQVNDDIIGQLGNFNIGNYIGDPRQISQSVYNNRYPDLETLSEAYFQKYIDSYDITDFIRLIKFFDNSLFKMIEDFTPTSTTLSSGVVIKQHLLERNKYRVPQMSSSFEDYTGSIKPQARDYNTGSSDYPSYSRISGSSIYVYSGGPGGMFNRFNSDKFSPSGSDGTGPDNRFGITQSFFDLTKNITGSVLKIRDDQREFYNGEFSGSTISFSISESCNQYFGIKPPKEHRYILSAFSTNGTCGTITMPASQFLSNTNNPPQGHAWLWGDMGTTNARNKIKYIKMNNIDYLGSNVEAFIRQQEFVSFNMIGAKNSRCQLLNPANGPQYYYIDGISSLDSTFAPPDGAFLIQVDQDPSSEAITSFNMSLIDFQLSASGDYTWPAAQNIQDEPAVTRNTNETASIPQGFFPSADSSSGYVNDAFGGLIGQAFRGWATAGYFLSNGVKFIGNGLLVDPLQGFNTGSPEVDSDDVVGFRSAQGIGVSRGDSNYRSSKYPWFMQASSSYKYIPSESFAQYSTLNADTASLTTNTQSLIAFYSGSDQTNLDKAVRYWYVENENKIYISGSQFIPAIKNNDEAYRELLTVPLIEMPNTGGIFYPYDNIPNNMEIDLQPDNGLFVFKGESTVNPGVDNNHWRYNRYMHRPYRIYMVTKTGSGEPTTPYSPFTSSLLDTPKTTNIASSPNGQGMTFGTLYGTVNDATQLGIIGNESPTNPVSSPALPDTVSTGGLAPFSGSFTVTNAHRQVSPFIYTRMSTYTNPLPQNIGNPRQAPFAPYGSGSTQNDNGLSGQGAMIMISKSDGTPITAISHSQTEGLSLNNFFSFTDDRVNNPRLLGNLVSQFGGTNGWFANLTAGGDNVIVDNYLNSGSYIYTSSNFGLTSSFGQQTASSADSGSTNFGLFANLGDYSEYEIIINNAQSGNVTINYIDSNGDATSEVILPSDFGGGVFRTVQNYTTQLTFTGLDDVTYGTTRIVNRYATGEPILGLFSTDLEGAYVVYSSSITESVSKFDKFDRAGSYQFTTKPNKDITVSSSVFVTSFSSSTADSLYGTGIYGTSIYGSGTTAGAGKTWTTASLSMYRRIANPFQQNYPGTLITKSVYHNDAFEGGVKLENNFIISNGTLDINEQLYMTLSVSSGSDRPDYLITSSLIAAEYSMSLSSSGDGSDPSVPTNFQDLSNFFWADNCQPLLNNFIDCRRSDFIQEIDQSALTGTGSSPINFQQIINQTATKACVPDSYYTTLRSIQLKYLGSKLEGSVLNEYRGGDTTFESGLGKVPVGSINKAYLGYFSEIVDPYPTLNNKTGYFVKYIIDESGNLFDPALTDAAKYNLLNTFTEYDPNSQDGASVYPTKAGGIAKNTEDKSQKVLEVLQNTASVYSSGKWVAPLLYSQTSSQDFNVIIPMTGSGYINQTAVADGYSDYSFTAVSKMLTPTFGGDGGTQYFSGSVANSNSSGNNYWPTTSNPVFISPNSSNQPTNSNATQSFDPSQNPRTGSVFFKPLDFYSPQNTGTPVAGQVLGDAYKLRGKITYFTTGIPYRFQDSGNSTIRTNTMGYFHIRLVRGLDETFATKSPIRMKILDAKLEIEKWGDVNSSNPTLLETRLIPDVFAGTNQVNYNNVTIPNGQAAGSNQFGTNVFTTRFYGTWLRSKIYAAYGGGGSDWRDAWIADPRQNTTSRPERGIYRYKWTYEVENNSPNDMKSGRAYRFEMLGNLIHFTGGSRTNDHYTGDGAWDRGFSPNVPRGRVDLYNYAQVELSLQGDRTAAASQENQALFTQKGDYWYISQSGGVPVTESNGNAYLVLSSSILNQAWEQNTFKQGDLEYTSSLNQDFPFNKEPDFIQFEPIRDLWKYDDSFNLTLDNEIRFENNEDLSYTILQVYEPGTPENPIGKPPGEPSNTQPMLKFRIDSLPPLSTNVDFFVLRRWFDSTNWVILEQQKPYGISSISTDKTITTTTPISSSVAVSESGSISETKVQRGADIKTVIPSTSPGILRPANVIDTLRRNPDKILSDITDKNLLS